MSAKTVVITGALSGIGEKCAIRFAAEDYSVIISGRNSDKGQTLLEELGNLTTNKIKYIYADISNESDVISLARQSEDFFGKVDVVLNVAGTEGNPSTYESSTVEDFHKVFMVRKLNRPFLGFLIMNRREKDPQEVGYWVRQYEKMPVLPCF